MRNNHRKGRHMGRRKNQKLRRRRQLARESAIRRVRPADVKELPAEFVEKLNARGCMIPQFDSGEDAAGVAAEPNNVIHGEFTRRGQEDWAVLCSNGKTSTIVIFWGRLRRVRLRWRGWMMRII